MEKTKRTIYCMTLLAIAIFLIAVAPVSVNAIRTSPGIWYGSGPLAFTFTFDGSQLGSQQLLVYTTVQNTAPQNYRILGVQLGVIGAYGGEAGFYGWLGGGGGIYNGPLTTGAATALATSTETLSQYSAVTFPMTVQMANLQASQLVSSAAVVRLSISIDYCNPNGVTAGCPTEAIFWNGPVLLGY